MPFFWSLDPLVSVGPVHFGELAHPLIKKYGLHRLEPEVSSGRETYEFNDCETRVYVEGGRIVCVGCFDELFYQGKNIFGLSFEEMHELLGPEDDIGEDICGLVPVEYEKLGLQIWLRNGFVDSVMCNGPTNEV